MSTLESIPLRETPVKTKAAEGISFHRFNPVRIFVNRERIAVFWFVIAVVAVVAAVVQPMLILAKLREPERVVVLDPAGTYHVSPLLDFDDAKALHVELSTLATSVFLNRSPSGFDQEALLKKVFLTGAYRKARKHQSQLQEEFEAKQLHQKAEISRIDLLETREKFVLSQVQGQLIRTGIFQGETFSEAFPFRLVLKMVRNPDLTRNGRFPTAILDYNYEKLTD